MKIEQYIVTTSAEHAPKRINPLLDNGWIIKFAIAESVSMAYAHSTSPYEHYGKIVFVLEKQTEE